MSEGTTTRAHDAGDAGRDAGRDAGTDAPAPIFGVVLSGTGGIWRVHLDSGVSVDTSLRGRLKRGDEVRRKAILARRAVGRSMGGRGSGRKREQPNVERPEGDDEEETLKLAVGDRVRVENDEPGGSWAIADILPRRSRLARRAPGGAYGERVVVANIDLVLVVFAAAQPDPHPRMLDRFLVIAEGNDIPARIVVNKIELTGEAAARRAFADYEKAGYPLHYTSVKDAIGLQPLHAELAGRTTALTGPSGVGKSSLMNALFPGLNLRTQEISASVNKGRHTTVGAFLHPLPQGGGAVVDTPGLREVGMWGLPPEDLGQLFPEFRPFLDGCRFADCTHDKEPQCALRNAVKDGAVSRPRYESYRKLREALESEATEY